LGPPTMRTKAAKRFVSMPPRRRSTSVVMTSANWAKASKPTHTMSRRPPYFDLLTCPGSPRPRLMEIRTARGWVLLLSAADSGRSRLGHTPSLQCLVGLLVLDRPTPPAWHPLL